MNINFLDLNKDILNIIGDYVKQDNRKEILEISFFLWSTKNPRKFWKLEN